MAMSKGYRVWEKSQRPSPHSILLDHRQKSEALLFESQAVAILSSQESDNIRKQYIKVLDAYGCLGVLQLNAGESSVRFLVLVTGCFSIGKIGDVEIFRVTQTNFVSLQYQTTNEDKISEVRKVLNSGTFYFSWNQQAVSASSVAQTNPPFDITLCAQRRYQTATPDNRFFWNRMMHIHLMRFSCNCDAWLLKVMCGSVEIRTIYSGCRQARAVIISRLSCERAGTRFNVRGTNDDGHVANFVETEQVIYTDNECTSYVQTRGSVPLFWEQPGVQVGSHKVKLSRGFQTSAPAFDRHLTTMKQFYGQQTIVNLLGSSLIGSKEGEAMLSREFQRHHQACVHHHDVPHIVFDYHQECRGGNTSALIKLKQKLESSIQSVNSQGGLNNTSTTNYGIFHCNNQNVVTQEQYGTIRTNCLDCLDRTNCVQTFIGLDLLIEQINALGFGDKKQTVQRFEEVFRQMWINNGDEVSKIYAGTGAIQGGSKLIDGARSAARTIQNNLLDNSKQEAIDILLIGSTLNSELADRARILLLSSMLHAPTPLLRELCKRFKEYTTAQRIRVSVGTYNVNGGKHFRSVVYKDVSLADWLLDAQANESGKQQQMVDVSGSSSGAGDIGYNKQNEQQYQSTYDYDLSNTDQQREPPVDIYAIGFQEIVDLNASNIMAASTDNAKAWADELQRVLSSRNNEYVPLTSQQLVGVCLYIFVRAQHTPYIRDVAIDSVKTGLGGATGNKGAAAIRFVLHGTSFCFVAAHFAAGQTQVAERNADYAEITRKVLFPMGRTLKSHDYVFWCGDFNYRIDMDKDLLKETLAKGDLHRALEFDQLKCQQTNGLVFNEFIEGEILFPPTYKYDLFSDDYDTSDKARAPAWTDRILWKRRKPFADSDQFPDWSSGDLIFYGRAELKQSDHRPVIAIVDIEISKISSERRQIVFNEVIKDLGPLDATIIIQADGSTTDTSAVRNSESDDTTLINIYDENLMSALIQELAQIGEVILVRYVGETMWITFRDGQSVLTAIKQRYVHVCGVRFVFKLKTDNWLAEIEREMALCESNTIPLCDHIEKKYVVSSAQPDYHSLGIPDKSNMIITLPAKQQQQQQSSPLRPAPPQRPPLPLSPQTLQKAITQSPQRTSVLSSQQPLTIAPSLQDTDLGTVVGAINIMSGALVPPNAANASVASEQPSSSKIKSNIDTNNSMTRHLCSDLQSSAIYEEIKDACGTPILPSSQPPPMPPPRNDTTASTKITNDDLNVNSEHSGKSGTGPLPMQSSIAPALPIRRGIPPPIPSRVGIPPPLPARPHVNNHNNM